MPKPAPAQLSAASAEPAPMPTTPPASPPSEQRPEPVDAEAPAPFDFEAEVSEPVGAKVPEPVDAPATGRPRKRILTKSEEQKRAARARAKLRKRATRQSA